MKLNKKKLQLKVKHFKENTIFLKLAVVLTLAVLAWHLGRYYEHSINQKNFEEFKKYTTETYYFVDPQIVDPYTNATSELFVYGALDIGRCLTREGLGKLIVDKDR